MPTTLVAGNNQQPETLERKLELGLVFLLLLGFWDANLPSPLDKAITVLAYGILPLLIIRRWKPCLYVATRDIFLLLLVGVALISIFWSVAPENTIKVSRGLLRSTFLGLYLAVRYTPKEQMRLLLWVFGITALLSLVVALAIPSYGIAMTNNELSWKGILLHKQYLGRMMAIGAVFFLLNALNNHKFRWIMWAGCSLAVALVFLSRSKTSLALSLLALLLLPFLKILKQNYKLAVALLMILLLLCGGLAVLVFSNLETIIVDMLGKDMTLNNRVPLWTLCLEKALERPWLGYGYAGFWPSEAGFYVFTYSWASDQKEFTDYSQFHSHNGFLEIFLQLGFLGLSLLILSLLSVFQRVVKSMLLTKTLESFCIFEYIILMLLFNYTENQTFVSAGTMWSLYVSVALSTTVWGNRIGKSESQTQLLAEKQGLG
jgi:O-antigen ligase